MNGDEIKPELEFIGPSAFEHIRKLQAQITELELELRTLQAENARLVRQVSFLKNQIKEDSI